MATPKKPRARKKPTEPTVPAGAPAFVSWQPGERPPWLDSVLAAPLPHGEHGGRGHPKWTESVRDALVSALAGCGSFLHASKIAGVSARVAEDWLARGRADQAAWEERLAKGEDPGPPTEHHVFARSVMLAGGWWAGRKIAVLQALGDDESTPMHLRIAILQWLLSRIGDKLTERVEVEHSGEVLTNTPEDVAEQMRERFEQIRERYQAVKGEAK